MSCRLINNPKTGEQIYSELWSNINKEVENDQLSDKLYGQLVSNNFRTWYGDWINNEENSSKVRDEITNEPLLLYHSSPVNFREFDEQYSKEIGFHFGTEKYEEILKIYTTDSVHCSTVYTPQLPSNIYMTNLALFLWLCEVLMADGLAIAGNWYPAEMSEPSHACTSCTSLSPM